jgi:hypothetical protein
MRVLCLTSKHLLGICLPLWYESVVCRYGYCRTDRQVFRKVLEANPDTASYVRNLTFATDDIPIQDRTFILSACSSIRYLDIRCVVLTGSYLLKIFLLPHLERLKLRFITFSIGNTPRELDQMDLSTSSLKSLSLEISGEPTNIQLLVGYLHRFPNLKELVLPGNLTLFSFLLSDDATVSFSIDILTITGSIDEEGSFYEYLGTRCSRLRTLCVLHPPMSPLKLITLNLPSLFVFRGEANFAASCIGPQNHIEEMNLTLASDQLVPPSMSRPSKTLTIDDIRAFFVTSSSLLRLEISVPSVDARFIEDILTHFPNLTTLKLISVSGGSAGPESDSVCPLASHSPSTPTDVNIHSFVLYFRMVYVLRSNRLPALP